MVCKVLAQWHRKKEIYLFYYLFIVIIVITIFCKQFSKIKSGGNPLFLFYEYLTKSQGKIKQDMIKHKCLVNRGQIFGMVRKLIVCYWILTVLTLMGCIFQKKPLKRNNDFVKDSEVKSKSEFKGLDYEKADIKFVIEGVKLELSYPIYIEKNRYLIPLTEVAEKFQGNINKEDGDIQVNLWGQIIKIYNNKKIYISNEDRSGKLKNSIIEKDDVYYITFNDFSNAFQLVSRWNPNDRTIKAYRNRNENKYEKYQKKCDVYGFIRLEDITADMDSESSCYYESLRIISENLGGRGIPFSIAWIPKYVDPANNIEEDPSQKNNMNISELIYTLDYMENNGGIIGLHGYTHQRGMDLSTLGSEFGRANPDIGDFTERVKKSIEISNEMGYDAAFFEAPHYDITKSQNDVLEDYFKIIYHPYKDEKGNNINTSQVYRSPGGKSMYIATPLDYVRIDDNGSEITSRIRHLPQGVMASLFFHPRLEMKYIELFDSQDGYPDYSENKDSILNKVIEAMQERGYYMKDIRSL